MPAMIDPQTLLTDDRLTLATARLRLRPMRRDDAEGLFLVFCDAQAMRLSAIAVVLSVAALVASEALARRARVLQAS